MFAEERKNLVVSMEYLNPIGMPVTIKNEWVKDSLMNGENVRM